MYRTHLGPCTFVAQDSHRAGRHWVSHFQRDERHRLLEEDRSARTTVLAVLASVMLLGLVLLTVTLIALA
jgi:hypothetical protein